MSRILKLLTTLCRQGTVLAIMALSTSALATDAKANAWAPPATAYVKFNSDSGRESSRAKIPVRHLAKDKFMATFESKKGHDSNVYCNHRAWIVDWEVTVDTGDDVSHNKPIEITKLSEENGKHFVPVMLCKKGIGNTFKVIWTAKSDTKFNSNADNCPTPTSCYTEVTIGKENPPVATLVLKPTTIDESGSRNTSTVTATLGKAASVDVILEVSAAPESPAVNDDFTLSQHTTLTIPAGSKASAGTVTITAEDNSVDAPDKTITVSATAIVAGVEDPKSTTLTINDDDPPPGAPVVQFASASSSAAENAGTHIVTVNLSPAAPSGGLTFGYSVSGTATAGSGNDFTIQNSGTLSVGANATTVEVPVVINDDSAVESSETVVLTLNGGTGYTVGSTSVHTLTIADNDDPPPSAPVVQFASASSSASEDDGTHNVTVNLSTAAPSGGFKLGYSVSGTATAGSGNDFTIQNSGTLSVSAGDITATIPVAIRDDSTNESAETVVLTLNGGTGYTVGSTSVHTLTITDNDGTAAQAILSLTGPADANEGNSGTSDKHFTVSLSGTPSKSVSWQLCFAGTATIDASASGTIPASADYQPIFGQAPIDLSGRDPLCTDRVFRTQGSLTNTGLGIRIKGDTDSESDETVIATLRIDTGPDDVVLGTSKVTYTILDDDGTLQSQPVITINGGNAVTEGTAASFTVNASPAPSASLEVNLNVSEETGGGQDYVASDDEGGATVTINAGSSTATFTVDTVADSTDEPNGQVMVAVDTGTGYSVGSTSSSASVTVNDDDGPPPARSSLDGVRSFSIDDATAMEKDGTINFTVRLSAATQGNSQASVRVATRDVTAVSGLDYQSLDTLVVFQAGETAKVVKIVLVNDAHNEGAETFEVVLSNASNAVIGDGVATGTINNADYVPQSELAHFGRSVANHVLEGVIDRISSPRSPGASARIAGNVVGKADRAPDPDCPGCGVLSTDKRVEKFDREEILTDSSFVLNGQDDSSHSPAFWGRGTRSYFRDKPGNLSVDGEVTSFMLGADLGWSERKIIGLALIRSSGKIDHMEKPGAEDPNTGMTKLNLTALVPYAGWKINDSIDIWGALGHGNGKMELDLNAGDTSEMIKTGFDWTMAAAGLRGDVVRPGPDGGPRLTALLDGYRVRTSSKETEGLAASKASVTRLRAGLEASWEMQLEDGSILIPRMETNLIQETGDVGSGFGLELVGGLSWSDPDTGLAIDLSARRLRSHDSPGRKDHGYSMALVYDPNPESERGLSVSMRQDRGNSESTMNGLLTSGLPETAAEDSISSQWTTELAYGFPVIDGSFTGSPHAGIEETDDYRDYKVGWRLTPAGPQAPDLSFDINAARRERLLSNSADHRLGVGLVAEW